MKPLAHLLQQFDAYGSLCCLQIGERQYTYHQLLGEVDHWLTLLEDRHVPTVVALRGDYFFSSIAALIALLTRGAVVAMIPRSPDASQYLAESRASLLLDFDMTGQWTASSISGSRHHELLEQLHASKTAGLLLFSSGTTGTPKAALHSADRFLTKFLKPGRRLRTLAFMLFDHVAGLDTLFYTLSNGGTLVVSHRRDPPAVLRTIESARVEVLPTSPTFLRLLCSSAHRCADVSSLKIVTYGSELMDAITLARLKDRLPGVRLLQKYGTTETGSPRSTGRGDLSLWMKIDSEDTKTRVMDGVLWIRNETTVLGYLNAPLPIDAEGWYRTGDLVDVDGEWIRFRGRETDTINVGGQKVEPAEVAQVIRELEFVRDVDVIGAPHPQLGQIVVASIVVDQKSFLEDAPRQVKAHCRARLAPHQVPIKVTLGVGPASDRKRRPNAGASD